MNCLSYIISFLSNFFKKSRINRHFFLLFLKKLDKKDYKSIIQSTNKYYFTKIKLHLHLSIFLQKQTFNLNKI